VTDETIVEPAYTVGYSLHDSQGRWLGTAEVRAYQSCDAVVYGRRPITTTLGNFDVILSRPDSGSNYSLVTVSGLETALGHARQICKIWSGSDTGGHMRFAIDGARGVDPLMADDL